MKKFSKHIKGATLMLAMLAGVETARAEIDAAALEKFLDGKDVVELFFSGTHAKAKDIREAVKVDSGWQKNFMWSATDMPGQVKVHAVLKLSTENKTRALQLLQTLEKKKVFWEPGESIAHSLAGNDEARDIARRMIKNIMADAEKNVIAAVPGAKWVTRDPPTKAWISFAETSESEVYAQLGIVDVTIERAWNLSENGRLHHDRIKLPHLGLVMRLVYTPDNREAEAALSKAIKPLVKLEADLEKK